jgi:hypothetical protein
MDGQLVPPLSPPQQVVSGTPKKKTRILYFQKAGAKVVLFFDIAKFFGKKVSLGALFC